MRPDRETALRILRKHNKDETHVRHALAVEETMRHFARRAGADEDLWGVVGILHDIDWEMTSDAASEFFGDEPFGEKVDFA